MKAVMPLWTDQPPGNGAFSLLEVFAVLSTLYTFNPPAYAANTELKLLTKSGTKKFKAALKTGKRGQWTAARQAARQGHSKIHIKLLRWMVCCGNVITAQPAVCIDGYRQNYRRSRRPGLACVCHAMALTAPSPLSTQA